MKFSRFQKENKSTQNGKEHKSGAKVARILESTNSYGRKGKKTHFILTK
jgi:hypothetical protein